MDPAVWLVPGHHSESTRLLCGAHQAGWGGLWPGVCHCSSLRERLWDASWRSRLWAGPPGWQEETCAMWVSVAGKGSLLGTQHLGEQGRSGEEEWEWAWRLERWPGQTEKSLFLVILPWGPAPSRQPIYLCSFPPMHPPGCSRGSLSNSRLTKFLPCYQAFSQGKNPTIRDPAC